MREAIVNKALFVGSTELHDVVVDFIHFARILRDRKGESTGSTRSSGLEIRSSRRLHDNFGSFLST